MINYYRCFDSGKRHKENERWVLEVVYSDGETEKVKENNEDEIKKNCLDLNRALNCKVDNILDSITYEDD